MTETRAQKCTQHCRACGQHFHSVASFDRHRQGPYTAKRTRHCVPAAEVAALQCWTTAETCDLGPSPEPVPATIWQVVADNTEGTRILALGLAAKARRAA